MASFEQCVYHRSKM